MSSEVLLDWLLEVKAEAPSLRLGQLIVLLQVAREEGLRMSELSERCEDTLSTTSRNVRGLTGADYLGSLGDTPGLLDLQRGGDDGRARHVVLSARGAELLARLSLHCPDPSAEGLARRVTH